MQKLATVLMCAAVMLGGTVRATGQDDLSSPKLRIEWGEFKKLYDAGKVVVVDVRDPIAFEASRIPGSINVPLDEVEKRVAELGKHDKPIVFYCA